MLLSHYRTLAFLLSLSYCLTSPTSKKVRVVVRVVVRVEVRVVVRIVVRVVVRSVVRVVVRVVVGVGDSTTLGATSLSDSYPARVHHRQLPY